MNLIKYRKLSVYEVEKVLDQYIHLTDEQKSRINGIDWFPFSIVHYQEPEEVNVKWRLTILFYWIYCLCIYLFVIPINWILFGKKYLNNKNIFYKIYDYWAKKLNF